MIGPAEIEDMLADYEEAMNNKAPAPRRLPLSWPVTSAPVPLNPVPYVEALERMRRAIDGGRRSE